MSTRDQFEITLRGSEWPKARSFTSGPSADFHLNWRPLEGRYDGTLPTRLLDLLRIASSVYFADLAVRRKSNLKPGAWRRSIQLAVPVFDNMFWQSEPVNSVLAEIVRFLTGDDWSLVFTEQICKNALRPERQRHIEFANQEATVCLYSGGLDSAAGLAHRLQQEPGSHFSPVTVGHRNDIRSNAVDQIAALKRLYGNRLHPVSIAFENRLRRLGLKSEPSQRSRSLLFLTVGGIVATIDGSDHLEAYESGIGAINVPLLAGMRESQSTRGMHPQTVRIASDVLSAVLERPFKIVTPFSYFTKGEVVRALTAAGHSVAVSTVSCAHYPVRHVAGEGHRQCGVCPACLFRRVALAAAGIDEPVGAYRYDLLDPGTVLPVKKLRPLVAFLNQVDAIMAARDGQLPVSITAHLKATGVLRANTDLKSFAALYRRYADDWDAFLRQGRRNGCHWTNMIDARSAAA